MNDWWRGIKLMLDLVVNHASHEHAWFTDSRTSTTAARRDWYWWRPPRAGYVGGTLGAEPTHWQPDLNWENPEVRCYTRTR